MKIEWHGQGSAEFATLKGGDKVVIRVNPQFYRPAEVDMPAAIRPRRKRNSAGNVKSVSELVHRMVAHDLEEEK